MCHSGTPVLSVFVLFLPLPFPGFFPPQHSAEHQLQDVREE